MRTVSNPEQLQARLDSDPSLAGFVRLGGQTVKGSSIHPSIPCGVLLL